MINFSLSHTNNGGSLFKRRIPVFIILIICFLSNSLLAETISDSLRKSFPEVRVEAKRVLSNSLSEFSQYSIISKSDLQKLGNIQVSEALQYIPGLFIKDYGGLGGMKSVSIRGSSANHTLVMINGIKLNSSQNGMTDLSNIPMSFISNIEVIRGGLAAAFGSNAIGGAVNIMTANTESDRIAFEGAFGSFNENILALTVEKNYEKINFKTSIEYRHSDGDYTFEIQHFGKKLNTSRFNADFTNYNAALSADYKFGAISMNTFALFYDTKRGVPGAVLQGHIESPLARMNESGALISINGMMPTFETWILRSGINYKMGELNFNDANSIGLGGKTLDNDFSTNDYNLSVSINNQSGFEILLESFHSDLVGDMLQPDVTRNPKRSGFALSIITDKQYNVHQIANIVLAGSLRADFFSDNYPVYSPFVGISLAPHFTDVKFIMNASSNFRMPSFNELYYLNYGTSNLKPERSLSLNIGLNYLLSSIYFEINGFRTITNDLIVSIPKSPAMWSAQNIGKADNLGIEFIAKYSSMDSDFGADLNYTLQSAKDLTSGSMNYKNDLVYVPQEIINANLSYNFFWDIMAAVNFNYTSFRYSLQSNDLSSVLPEYFTINIKLIKNFNTEFAKLNFYIASDNITNERFSVIRNYPMQGRIIRAGIGLGFGE